MRRIISGIAALLTLIIINCCITPFEPEGIASIDNMIVIEGDIIQNDITRVIVSRSLSLNQENKVDYISRAKVWVESETGTRYNGYETKDGDRVEYQINTTGIDPEKRYKLCVVLGTTVYESDLVPVLQSPQIDTIGFFTDELKTSVTFYVNSHDPTNSTRYYRWSYTEDWEFQSLFRSTFEYIPANDTIVEIPWSQNRYNCWSKGVSNSILIASTAHLSQDVVHRKDLVTFGPNDRRVNYLYSMELTQMALSRDAYQYWDNIKKNSDNIGGIFSPQPSEIRGNIHNRINPNETVIGYISAATVSKKRVFVYASDIGIYTEPKDCEVVTIDSQNNIPSYTMYITGYDIISNIDEVMWAPRRCVDCRLYGTKVKPWFWPSPNI